MLQEVIVLVSGGGIRVGIFCRALLFVVTGGGHIQMFFGYVVFCCCWGFCWAAKFRAKYGGEWSHECVLIVENDGQYDLFRAW